MWTYGNPGRDPFGDPIRPLPDLDFHCEAAGKLAELGAYGVNLHDNDLVPIDATPSERDRIAKTYKAALDAAGLKVPMATTNLFSHPVFKDGAFTAADPTVRAYALRKAMEGIDLGMQLGPRSTSSGAAAKAARSMRARTRRTVSRVTVTLSTS